MASDQDDTMNMSNEHLEDEMEDSIMGEDIFETERFEDVTLPQLPSRSTREVFLITYSQSANHYTKESFSNIILQAFLNSGNVVVEKWVCAKELHKNVGFHFHMTVKLNKQKRWAAVKRLVEGAYPDIHLHFSDRSKDHADRNLYDGAYHYTIKGGDFIVSENHPPVAAKAGSIAQKMKNIDFMNLVIEKNLKTMLEVKALAKNNSAASNHSLRIYFSIKGEKKISEMLRLAWDIEDAPEALLRLQKNRVQLLKEATASACSCPKKSLWQLMASQILHVNNIGLDTYTQAILAALTLGRGKFRNIMHIGGTNRAKTFLMKPLRLVYNAFENPSHGNFNWAGVDEKEIILLNDFRWAQDVIPWEQFLLLLEGDPVQFPVKFQNDIRLLKDTPIFATSRSPITFGKCGEEAETENKMMKSRWKTFQFTHHFVESKQIECLPCMHCYANFILCINVDDF